MTITLPLLTFNLDGSATGHTLSGTTIQADAPLIEAPAGYLIVAAVLMDTERNVTSNDGYTPLTKATGTGRNAQIWYKFAGASENLSPTWTHDGAAGPDSVVLLHVLAVDAYSDGEIVELDTESAQLTASGTTHTTLAVTPTANLRCGMVAVFGLANCGTAAEFNPHTISGANLTSLTTSGNIQSNAGSAGGITGCSVVSRADLTSGSYQGLSTSADTDLGVACIAVFRRVARTDSGATTPAPHTSLTPLAAQPFLGAAPLAGGATLTPSSASLFLGSVPLASHATLTPAGLRVEVGAAPLTSHAVLGSATFHLGIGSAAPVSGAALVPQTLLTTRAAAPLTGGARLLAVSPVGITARCNGAQYNGVMYDDATATTFPADAPLAGAATLAPTSTRLALGAAPLAGGAVLTGLAGASLGDAAFASGATIVATTLQTAAASAALASRGVLTPASEPTLLADAAFTSRAVIAAGAAGPGIYHFLDVHFVVDAEPLLEPA